MISAKLIKARRKQEALKKEMDAALEKARELRAAWEKEWLAYLDEAARLGFCRCCVANGIMRKKSECHETHILLAAAS